MNSNRVRLFDMLTFLLTELNLAGKLFMLSNIFVAMLNNSIKPVPNNNTSNPTQAAQISMLYKTTDRQGSSITQLEYKVVLCVDTF